MHLGGIDVDDLVFVAGVGTAGETMKVTGITTNSALQPSTATDWYDSQTLGLDNATVYWKSIAPKTTKLLHMQTLEVLDLMKCTLLWLMILEKNQELLDRS